MVPIVTLSWSMSGSNSTFRVDSYEKEVPETKKTKQREWLSLLSSVCCYTIQTTWNMGASKWYSCSSNLLVFSANHILWIIFLSQSICYHTDKHQCSGSAVNTTAKTMPLTTTCKLWFTKIVSLRCIICELSVGRSVSPGLMLMRLVAGQEQSETCSPSLSFRKVAICSQPCVTPEQN